MKRTIYILELIFLHLAPIVLLALFLSVTVFAEVESLRRVENYSWTNVLSNISFLICFILIAVSSLLVFHNKCKVVSVIIDWFAVLTAIVRIEFYTIELINKLNTIKLMYLTSFVLLVFSFFIRVNKTKKVLAIILSALFLISGLFSYIQHNTDKTFSIVGFMFCLLNLYPFCTVILTRLFPIKLQRGK